MSQNTSDFKRFCKTMLIMSRDIWPWIIGAGIIAAVFLGVRDVNAKGTASQNTDAKTALFQRQR